MDLKPFDVLVVSAFGRGHWIAAELARERMRVLLLDVTTRLGNWPVEDQSGPFGVFRYEGFSPSYLERWTQDDPVEMLENGLTVWPPGGPIELKGPLTRLHLQKMGWPEGWTEPLAHARRVGSASPEIFHKTWIASLAYQLAATVYRPSALAMSGGRPLPVFASFGVRFPSRHGLMRNLDWLRSLGVTVSDRSELVDLSFSEKKQISGVELKGEMSGLVRFNQLVWCLTGGETGDLSAKLVRHLYPGGVVEASWCWIRYRLKVQPTPDVSTIPLHSVWIREIGAPWTHGNLMVVQKTPSPEGLDAWVRLPVLQRFNRDYLEEQGRRILSLVNERLPLASAEIQSYPQEATYPPGELGQPRFPVWDEGTAPSKGRRSFENARFDSPEDHMNYSLDCEYDAQKTLVAGLLDWWRQLNAQKEAQP